ncbi:hypothetical protein [Streptomyces sp. NBC_00306]|uniref:hypothetical protein n=1 Tax=Streptomyces sp. NBC_00306 TaxID=2975708 RepID=UPI002E2D70AA|nr:hypothetical protein [Streptomyces sp. NBC_00306]
MTAPRDTKKVPEQGRYTPAPSTPEGELFHYKPDEAARYLPFSGRKLRELAYSREIPHVNNGNSVWFSGLNIRAISEQFTVQPLAADKRPAALAATA